MKTTIKPTTTNMNRILYGLAICFCINLYGQDTTFEWAKTFGCDQEYPSFEQIWLTKVDQSGNVYSIGGFNNTVDFDPGPGEALLSSEDQNDFDLFIR